ncbi:MAG: FkbM family methyltransferase [Bacteroidia bacterium]
MIAQLIFNALLSNKGKWSNKLLTIFRMILVKISDPIIIWNYHGIKVKMNLSHDLAFNIKAYPTYNQNLGIVAEIMAKKYPAMKIIDVGANVGDSVAIIQHKIKAEFLCIEGNPKFIPLLKENQKNLQAVEIEQCFVGEETSKVKPVNNLGTAYLEKDEEGIEIKTISSVIESHPQFKTTKLIKIDTDGFDNKIIRGAKSFLLESKASIFFEYDPFYLAKQNEIGTDIFQFLVGLGYSKFVIFNNFGIYLTTLSTNEIHHFMNFHQYFNNDGSTYMDIWAIHEVDHELDFKKD